MSSSIGLTRDTVTHVIIEAFRLGARVSTGEVTGALDRQQNELAAHTSRIGNSERVVGAR